MCILFSYVSKRLTPGEFKLIILSNRDEFFQRPSHSAKFINDSTIYGTDQTLGKEGGTWLGASKHGKIAALINLDRLDYGADDNKLVGRGFLVPNFLNSQANAHKYIENQVKKTAGDCNPFNLLMFEKNNNDFWNIGIFENFSNMFKYIDHDFVSISNHLYEKPYPKTVVGENLFKDVVSKYNKLSSKEDLLKSLIDLSKYDAGQKFTESIETNKESVRKMMHDQVFIDIPDYGTRTHTIILVDENDKMTYYETTLKLPIDSENRKWEESFFEFDLKSETNEKMIEKSMI